MNWTRYAIGPATLALAVAGALHRGGAASTNPAGHQGEEHAEAPSKKLALLVGIDKYKSDKIPPLLGAVNDVSGMEHLLVGRFGFRAEEVLLLTNERATHEAIVRAFREHLIARSDARAVALFYFSGCGPRMQDVDGDELDGWDETVVPHDSRFDSVFDIDDDEQGGLFAELGARTRHTTAVFDCALGIPARRVLREVVVRPAPGTGQAAAPPIVSEIASDLEPDGPRSRWLPSDVRQPPAKARRVGAPGGHSGHASGRIFASDEGEQAYEYGGGGKSYGTLSFFLREVLLRADPGAATYEDVPDLVAAEVQRVRPGQRPKLEGEGISRVVFGVESASTRRYYPASMDGLRVAIQAGRLQGLSMGSLFDVYAPWTKAMVDPARAIARVRLVEVGPVESRGELVSGRFIPEASRAVEREHHEEGRRIKLRLDDRAGDPSPMLAALRARLEETAGLGGKVELVDRAEGADFVIRREGGGATNLRSPPIVRPSGGGTVSEDEPRAAEHLLSQVLQYEGSLSDGERQGYPLTEDTYPARIHGLFIGIDKYRREGSDISLHELQGCVNDARAMPEALKPLTDMHFSLFDEAATKAAILDYRGMIVQQSQPNDLIIVFISSHGTIRFNDYYVIPHDVDLNRRLSTSLPFGLVTDALNSRRGAKSMIIIDSCRSGRSGFNVARYGSDEHETSIMVSSGPNEVSSERMANGRVYGLFAVHLLEGLAGPADDNGDRKITIRELFGCAYIGTKDASGKRQHPVYFGSLSQNIILKSLKVPPRPLGGARAPAGTRPDRVGPEPGG
jgi:hypothetical protein